MRERLIALERKLHQQLLDRIAAMEGLKAAGAAGRDEWWQWKGVMLGLGAAWKVFARRLVVLMLGLRMPRL